MKRSGRVRGRLALLAAGSLAATGGGMAAAETATAAGPPTTLGAYLTLAGVGIDGQTNQDTTVPFSGPTSVQAYMNIAVTAPPGALVDSVHATCGTNPAVDVSPPAPTQHWAVSPHCTIASPSVTTFTLEATDDLGQTATVTEKLTIVPPPSPTVVPVDRYDGASRYGTGIAASQAAFPTAGSAGAVVLARGDEFADALAGIPLAKAKNGPLLLTAGGPAATTLSDGVDQELLRVLPADGAHTVYILGGTGAISPAVEDHVKALGYDVVRLAGDTRTGTALAVAEDPRALDNPAHVIIARGDDYADALTAGPLAAGPFLDSHGVPAAIVLTSGPGAAPYLDPASRSYVLSKLSAPIDNQPNEPSALWAWNVAAVGGAGNLIAASLPDPQHVRVLAGADRYGTAAAVADVGWGGDGSFTHAVPYFQARKLGLATGEGFADALTGGAYMALAGGPLMLTPSEALTSDAVGLLTPPAYSAAPVSAVVLFGGAGVLSDRIVTGPADSVASSLTPNTVTYQEHGSAY